MKNFMTCEKKISLSSTSILTRYNINMILMIEQTAKKKLGLWRTRTFKFVQSEIQDPIYADKYN